MKSQKEYRLATNVNQMSNEEVSDTYRQRWQIEVLWKFLKMHLKLDRLITKSMNGVRLQIYMALIAELNLKWKRRGRAILGDESECVFNVYEAVLVWDGNFLTIPIDEADSEPLVGMSLREGYQLMVQVFESGHVELSKVATV